MSSGLFVGGWITYLLRTHNDWDWKEPRIYSSLFYMYAIVGFIKVGITLLLSEKCEPDENARREADMADRETTAPLLNEGYRRTQRRGVSGKATGAVRGVWRGVYNDLITRESPHSTSIVLPFRPQLFCFIDDTSNSNELVRQLAVSLVRHISGRIRDGRYLVGREYSQSVLCLRCKTIGTGARHGNNSPT